MGANVVCTTSAVLQGGPEAVTGMLDGLRSWLAERGYDPIFGARPLRRLIQTSIGDPLARMLISGEVTDGGTVRVDRSPEGAADGLALQAVAG